MTCFLHVALSEVVSERRSGICHRCCVLATRPGSTGASLIGEFTFSNRVESCENSKINYREINELNILSISVSCVKLQPGYMRLPELGALLPVTLFC